MSAESEVPPTFEALGVCPQICEACSRMGYSAPTDIQRQSLPFSLEGRDIIALAETGSGKTAAFAIPVLQKLLDNPQAYFALVLAPTRELAYQIEEHFNAMGSTIGVKCLTIVGGMDMMAQSIALARKPHVIIGTPGRIVDHLQNTKGFTIDKLKYLVFDEADRLLNMEFEKEINQILEIAPKNRTTLMFSATMTSQVAKLQKASLKNPAKIEASQSKYQTVKTLIQNYVFVPAKHKDCYLVYLLSEEFSGCSAIIFTDTIKSTEKVTLLMRNLGFQAIPLHGKMSQPKRLGALGKFKAGGDTNNGSGLNKQILIATDVASRGLDIPSVDLVINYDIPTHSKDYIHRVGRTARAGRSGRSLTIVTQYDVELFQRIEELIEKKMDLYPLEPERVLMFSERTAEAQRMASLEIRELEEGKGKKKDFVKAARAMQRRKKNKH